MMSDSTAANKNLCRMKMIFKNECPNLVKCFHSSYPEIFRLLAKISVYPVLPPHAVRQRCTHRSATHHIILSMSITSMSVNVFFCSALELVHVFHICRGT